MPEAQESILRLQPYEFMNCSLPLVFAGRYFLFEPASPGPKISVMFESQAQPWFEILKNEPVKNDFSKISTSDSGVLTVEVKDHKKNHWLYEVHVGSEPSIITVVFKTKKGFSLSAEIGETHTKIGEKRIENCIFDGVRAGVMLYEDGSIVARPPVALKLLRWFKQPGQ